MGKKAAEELLEAVETGGTVDKYIQVKETGLTREGSIVNSYAGPDDHLHGAGGRRVAASVRPTYSPHGDCDPHCREDDWSKI